jgi:hypothetical protein
LINDAEVMESGGRRGASRRSRQATEVQANDLHCSARAICLLIARDPRFAVAADSPSGRIDPTPQNPWCEAADHEIISVIQQEANAA